MYHHIGPLFPEGERAPLYSQLYIYDPADALQHRKNNNPQTRSSTMTAIQHVIMECNPLVQVYLHAAALARASSLPEYRLKLDFLRATDRRRYNLPSTQYELAAIIPGDVETLTNPRDVIVRARGGALMRISELHPSYIALHFPLLAPTGQESWTTDWRYRFLPHHHVGPRTRLFMTFCDFLKHRLHIRPCEFESNHYYLAGPLLQEFIVDMWAASEHSRLEWIRYHQETIRADLYSGVVDALREGLDLSSVGRKVILPSSFTSGPRFMQKNLQDALALLRIFKGSDLFITFTANPAWLEISEALLPGQAASDRPDLVARVFNLKFTALLNDIMKRRIFGHALGYVYTIEYQKRGLPHAHLIVFLHADSRLSTPERVDAFISTEFPDVDKNPVLHELVKTHMTHGPCGVHNYSSCLNNKQECTKGFPKPFQSETDITGETYVKTRRRNDGRSFTVRNGVVDNRYVVSYSPYLLLRYQAHINVECTNGFNAIKYIYKVTSFDVVPHRLLTFYVQYVYKGPDRASVAVHADTDSPTICRDEIKLYVDARYISASEAYARSMGWSTHKVCLEKVSQTMLMLQKEFPAVKQLQVHLENEQTVAFRPDGSHSLRTFANGAPDTQLTGFFKANRIYPEARQLYYVDFPTRFVWRSKACKWILRKKRTAYGRMVYIPPNVGEKFYARLVLAVAKDLRSFDDLRTFEGILYPTIREACFARGLLQDDGEWRRCLEEGKTLQTGFILRALFVVILRDCSPAQPLTLWHDFKSFLCDDLERELLRRGIRNPTLELVFDYGLYLIEQRLQWESSRTMKDVGMDAPVHDWKQLLSNSLLQEQLQFDPQEELVRLLETLPMLNDEQSFAFNSVLDSVLAEDHKAFFVVGAAGAGKTFLYRTICHAVRSRALTVLCVAYSGIAAQLLPGGRTAHSTFKIPFDVLENSACAIPKRSILADLLKTVKIIIWDECSAQHRFAIEAVDQTLKDVRDSIDIFGGITVVFGGDFLQTLPVVKSRSRSHVVHASLLSSPLWSSIEPNVVKLEKNMRVGNNEEDRQFAEWQRQLARGVLNSDDELVELPLRIHSIGDRVEKLINHIYPSLHCLHTPSFYSERCILSPRNVDAQEINDAVLDTFPGVLHEFWASDQALDPLSHLPDENDYPPEVLHSLNPSGFPLAQLCIKLGCPIMILRNLQPKEGVCNGSRGIVTRISPRVLEVQLFSGQTVLVPRIKLISSDQDVPFRLARLQFPVSLSFAMTINKSQGQTFDVVGVDLRHPVFSHGQLYVALSRCRHFSTLKCITSDKEHSNKTKNVVFREVVI